MTMFRTQSLSTSPLPVIVLQLPISNISDPSESSSTASDDNAPIVARVLTRHSLTSCCKWVLEKLCTFLIGQPSANKADLLSSRQNQLYRSLRRTPRSPRRKRQQPSSRTKKLLDNCRQGCHSKLFSSLCRASKNGGQMGGSLPKS